MKLETIDLYKLKDLSQLSAVRCADLSEAAAVCLDFHGHVPSVTITSEGDLKANFKLVWEEVTQQMKDSRSDMGYTVESGAYCVAMLLIEKLTGLKVVSQSQKRTGFDYWLGDATNFGMQGLARLEVSGILQGTRGQINQRLKEKVKQTQKSDNLNIPAFVVIVEFSQPTTKSKKR